MRWNGMTAAALPTLGVLVLCGAILVLMSLAHTGWAIGPKEDVAGVVAAALQRSVDVEDYLPDRRLLQGASPVLIREDIEDFKITPKELPPTWQWRIRTRKDIDALADSLNRPLYFVTIDRVSVNGDNATIEIGTGIAVPKPKEPDQVALVLCCCIATDHYARTKEGQWRFTNRVETWCA
jgi:hypothetical protein